MGYCSRGNVFAIGLQAEAFARPARRIEGADPSTGTLILRSHGLALGAALTLAVLSSSTLGATPAALPGGLAIGHVYGAAPTSSDALQLLDAPAGALIPTFSSAPVGAVGLVVDSGADLDAAIEAATAVIDEHARAHKAPIQAAVLPLVCAYLAVRIYVSAHATMSPAYAEALEAPSFLRSLLDRLFDRWMSGAPIAGAVDASPKVAEMGSKAVRLRGRGFLSADDREDLV